MPDHFLHTDRLTLKPITPAVVHKCFEDKSKDEIISFYGFDEEGYEKLKKMHLGGMETYNLSLFFFLLISNENNSPVGQCGFHTWNKVHHRAELFYYLYDDTHKQKRYMSEALPLILDFGFAELKLNRIEALVASWNGASLKLLQNNGFVFEGTMRKDYLHNEQFEDSDCYSLLKADRDKT